MIQSPQVEDEQVEIDLSIYTTHPRPEPVIPAWAILNPYRFTLKEANPMSEQTQTARTWTEAPASAAIKVQLNGYDVTLTLRGETGADVLPRLQSAIAWLEQHGGQPTGAAASAPDTPANGPREGDPAWCPIHNCQMARKEKNGDVWYSHKAPDGSWCRGAKAK